MSNDDRWKSGYPIYNGPYYCRIKIKENVWEECILHHWLCVMSNRHEWIDKDGNYVRGEVIQYKKRVPPSK